MVNAGITRLTWWLGLSVACALIAISATITAVRRLAHGDLGSVVVLPVDLLLSYWVGVGAWRRHELRSA